MAVTLPLALVLIDYLKLETIGRRRWLDKLPFLLLAAVFSAALAPAMDASGTWAPFYRRLAAALYNLCFYVYTLAWPFDLSAMYVLPLGGGKFLYVLAAAAAAGAGLLLKYCRGNKALIFGAGFYAVMLLPVLQFLPFGPVLSADRYTYLSSLGLFICACAAGGRLWARAGAWQRKTLVALVVLVALTFTLAARLRCAVWKDSVTLWSDTLSKQPSAGPALVGLCAAYLLEGTPEQAGACLTEAIRRYPEKDDNYCNLGLLLAKKGDLAAAKKYFERTLELNGRHAMALFSLGNIAYMGGDAARAERLYLRSLHCGGAFAPALRNLGKIAAGRKDKAAALAYYRQAVAADPADAQTRETAAALEK
jgi:tetratricopeptide (TPR) repeat protein